MCAVYRLHISYTYTIDMPSIVAASGLAVYWRQVCRAMYLCCHLSTKSAMQHPSTHIVVYLVSGSIRLWR